MPSLNLIKENNMLFGKQANILENIEHVNIIDKWARIQGFSCNESDCLYLADRAKKYFGTDYREQDLIELSDQIKQILVCSNSLL